MLGNDLNHNKKSRYAFVTKVSISAEIVGKLFWAMDFLLLWKAMDFISYAFRFLPYPRV